MTRRANGSCLRRVLVFSKQVSIGQIGKRIVAGQMANSSFIATLLGYVLVCRHPAAIGHGRMGDGYDAAIFELEQFEDVAAVWLMASLEIAGFTNDRRSPALQPSQDF